MKKIIISSILIFAIVFLSVCGYAATEGTLSVSAVTDKLGNIFFTGESVVFDVDIVNTFAVDKRVEFSVVDNSGNNANITKAYSIPANGTGQMELCFEVTEYGTFCLRVKSGEDIILEVPFSMIIKNEGYSDEFEMGIHGHFMANHKEHEKSLEIVKNAGFSNIRYGSKWNDYQEDAVDGVASPVAVPAKTVQMLNRANELGLRVMPTFRGNIGTANETHMPNTVDERNAFADFVIEALEGMSVKPKYIELWNEPNLEKFSDAYNNPVEYAKLLRVVYDKVKEDSRFADIEICAPAVSEVDVLHIGWLNGNNGLFAADTDGDGTADGYKWFDALSIHHYAKNEAYESKIEDIERIEEALASLGRNDVKFYHTEFGVTQVGMTQEEQATRLSQYLLTLRANRPGDKFFIYDFSNDGLDTEDGENNFGLVEAHNADIPYAAKLSFAAVSNMNNLLNGYSSCDITKNGDARELCFNKDFGKYSKVYALYSLTDNVSYSFNPNSEVTFFDAYGNEIGGSTGDLTLNRMPIYAAVERANEIDVICTENGSTATVNAQFKAATIGNSVGIKVIDKFGKLCWIDQSVLDKNHSCSFELDLGYADEHNYSVWYGMDELNGIYITDGDKNSKMFLYITKNDDSEVKSLSSISAGEKILVKAVPLNGTESDFTVICACYDDSGALKTFRNYSKAQLKNDGVSNYAEIAYDDISGINTVKFYVFDSLQGMIPLSESIRVDK